MTNIFVNPVTNFPEPGASLRDVTTLKTSPTKLLFHDEYMNELIWQLSGCDRASLSVNYPNDYYMYLKIT